MHAYTLLHVFIALFIIYTHATPVAPRAEMVHDMESSASLGARDWSVGLIKARNGAIYARGLAASQERLLLLTKRKSDLEFRMQIIDQARVRLANNTASANQQLATLAPGSPGAAQVQAQIKSIQDTDRQLETQQKQLDTEHAAVEQEIEAVNKIIGKNIDSGFKNFGSGRRA